MGACLGRHGDTFAESTKAIIVHGHAAGTAAAAAGATGLQRVSSRHLDVITPADLRAYRIHQYSSASLGSASLAAGDEPLPRPTQRRAGRAHP